MTDFFRFPHTPHIAWLGSGSPRDDKVLSLSESEALLAQPVLVEEKVDGANLGLSLDTQGKLRAQNRGQYLIEPYGGQFSRLRAWLAQHEHRFVEHMDEHLILFGEWCAAKHSLDYASLPDWFLLFDVYDRRTQKFWSSQRRDQLAQSLGLALVPALVREPCTLKQLVALVNGRGSRYRAGPLEGLVIRQESALWCEARAKLVRAEFTQTIGDHWRSRAIEWNHLAPAQGSY